jgi:hypothetical protein
LPEPEFEYTPLVPKQVWGFQVSREWFNTVTNHFLGKLPDDKAREPFRIFCDSVRGLGDEGGIRDSIKPQWEAAFGPEGMPGPTDTAWPMDFEDVVDCAEPQGWTVAPIIFYLTTWVMATLYLPEADDNPHKPKS